MFDLSADYMQKCTAATRNVSFVYILYPPSGINGTVRINGDDAYSVKITVGKTTGGFGIGNSISSVLSMSLAKSVQVSVGDIIRINVCFDGVVALSNWYQHEWVELGLFYIDSVRKTDSAINITGFDRIIKLEKSYKSTLTYPAKCSDVLAEIGTQASFRFADDFCAVNDAVIAKEPVVEDGEGNKTYYTRRQIIEFIAAINGGNARLGVIRYSDDDFHYANWGIKRYSPTAANYTIQSANVIKQNLEDTTFAVTDVVWNKSGVSVSLDDDTPEGVIEFSVPLEFEDEDTILRNVKSALVGVTYSGMTLQKQGTGIFELGDLVQYQPPTGDALPVLVMGITYSIVNGAFTETIYSLAKTATQQAYSGAVSGATSSTIISGGSLSALTDYEYISDISVKVNGVTYAVEKNNDGLISKISDSDGNELEPTITGAISDVSFQNAVFWAVAMARGLNKSKTPDIDTDTITMPFMDGIFGYFLPENVSLPRLRWYNYPSISQMPMTLVNKHGSTYSNGELNLNSGDYGRFECNKPNIFYVIAKFRSKGANSTGGFLVAKGTTEPNPIYQELGLLGRSGNYEYFIPFIYSDDVLVPSEPVTSHDYAVCCVAWTAQEGMKFYCNGKLLKTDSRATNPASGYNGSMYINTEHRYGQRYTITDNASYKFLAFGDTVDEIAIIKNSQWLMKKYGIKG